MTLAISESREITPATQKYTDNSMAGNTRDAYRKQWQAFVTWCADRPSLPAAPATIAAYLSFLADARYACATIDLARAAIRKAHMTAGYDDPTGGVLVEQTLRGIRRTLGRAQRQKAPVLTTDLRRMLDTIPDTLKGKRDRALLLLGFTTANRRSELVRMDVEDITLTADGLLVLLRQSKTDREGVGFVKGVAYGRNPDTCPVRAYQDWLQAAGITTGAVFREVTCHGELKARLTPQTVALVVKKAAQQAGLNPADYAGHSLRAGLVTSADAAGASVGDIMRQTGHRSPDTVQKYIRKARVFDGNVSGRVGL